MRVAVYHNNKDIRLQDIPTPKLNGGELIVKVRASGICGTDVMEWYRVKKGPRVLGHEITGEVVESKSGLFQAGQRVFVSHHVPCNECKYCRAGNHTGCKTLREGHFDPGGFSEYVRVPKINVERGTYLLPGGVSNEEGTMIEPLACCVRAQRVIGVQPGQTVLILGCGVSGLLNILVAKQIGATVLATDINAFRLEKANELGADETIDVSRDDVRTKADHVILCTGSLPAIRQAFNAVDTDGTILFFAIPSQNIELPVLEFWREEWTLTSSYGAAPGDLEQALKRIVQKKVDVKKLITHKLPLEDIQKGFDLVTRGRESLKVLIEP